MTTVGFGNQYPKDPAGAMLPLLMVQTGSVKEVRIYHYLSFLTLSINLFFYFLALGENVAYCL